MFVRVRTANAEKKYKHKVHGDKASADWVPSTGCPLSGCQTRLEDFWEICGSPRFLTEWQEDFGNICGVRFWVPPNLTARLWVVASLHAGTTNWATASLCCPAATLVISYDNGLHFCINFWGDEAAPGHPCAAHRGQDFCSSSLLLTSSHFSSTALHWTVGSSSFFNSNQEICAQDSSFWPAYYFPFRSQPKKQVSPFFQIPDSFFFFWPAHLISLRSQKIPWCEKHYANVLHNMSAHNSFCGTA